MSHLTYFSRRLLFPVTAVAMVIAMLLDGPLAAHAGPTLPSFAGGTPISFARWATVAGSLPIGLKQASRLARVSSDRQVGVTVSLSVRDRTALNSFISDLYNPSSPSYHHFLTVQQFAQRFGPTEQSHAEVTSWLQADGLRVTGTSANGLAIRAVGPASKIQTAFNTPLYTFKANSTTFIANTNAVRVPGDVAPDVVAVTGLSTKPVEQPADSVPFQTTGRFQGYTPTDIRNLYDFSSIVASGTTGSGQTIAISAFADYDDSDIAAYDSQYGLTSHISRINVSDGGSSGAPTGENNGQDETEADIELLQAAAPGAKILVYEAPNDDLGTINMYNRIVSDNQASIVSNSWGADELDTSASDFKAMDQTFQEAVAQGQAVFSASGDNGAYDAAAVSRNGSTTLVVDYPASDPFVTGVGGTSLTSNNGAYGGETVWSDNSDPREPAGSGGGLSQQFTRPSWQTGPGVDNQYSNGMRQVPDVSADADPDTGYTVYAVNPRNNAGFGVVGGTSAAAPVWSGFTALVQQNLGRRIGAMNYTLYALGQKASTFAQSPFHDVTEGTNLYYPATTGWDFATGWGSFDGAAFLTDVKTVPIPTATPTYTPTATPTPKPTPTNTAIPPSLKVKQVLLLHRVNGVLKSTGSLKSGEAGTVMIVYSTSHAGSLKPSGRVTVKHNGKLVATITLKRTSYAAKSALSGTVKIASSVKSGNLQLHIALGLGSTSVALNRTYKLVGTP